MQHHLKRSNENARFRKDLLAKRVVTSFGWLVLVTFFLLIAHIVGNSLPLLKTPKIEYQSSIQLPKSEHLVSIRHGSEEAIFISRVNHIEQNKCGVGLYELSSVLGKQLSFSKYDCNNNFAVIENDMDFQHAYARISDSGTIELRRIEVSGNDIRALLFGSFDMPESTIHRIYEAEKNSEYPLKWQSKIHDNVFYLWSITSDNQLIRITKTLNNYAPAILFEKKQIVDYMPLVNFSQHLYVNEERIVIHNSQDLPVQTIDIKNNANVHLLPNEYGFLVSEDNAYKVWGGVNKQGVFEFQAIASYENLLSGRILSLTFDRQSAVIFALTEKSRVLIINNATFEVVNEQPLRMASEALFVIGNSVYLQNKDKLFYYASIDLQGVTTWKSLFSPIQYLGYLAPSHIWQTSTASNEAQQKFSLVPLILGSLKASFLALFVAVPLALGAAIYTAYFATNEARTWIKPGIEMIEAIPSVIIGFIAAVWLAPFAERSLIAIVLLIALLPVVLLGVVALHGHIRNKYPNIAARVSYLPLLCLALTIASLILFLTTTVVQEALLSNGGNFLVNYLGNLTLTKTSIVVALALGVAITPTIYTLVDDALYEVPDGVKQAAFALGATEIQTLLRVVLLVALPSIISAVMLGFGRAFGETMIVLMVTGNTPIADWDLLSGLRSLTSNLTIELQESSQGSKHYNILFLTAAILFAFTFVINTVAAFIKRSLRAKVDHE
ncbi:ABC transporter permease subunit [Agaribacter marinus]|nr:ABC transporter permease subunit [Agaribacter marinus]